VRLKYRAVLPAPTGARKTPSRPTAQNPLKIKSQGSIPRAANRKTESVDVEGAVHNCVAEGQKAIPGVARPRIRRTPPESVDAHRVETASIEAEATRQPGEPA